VTPMLDYSGNAAIAKVRALYGKRLKAEDYNALLQKKNVGEVAGYLKNDTYYAPALEEVKEELIHREQLEYLVRRFGLDTYVRLLKYSRNDNLFFRLHLMEREIAQILLAIRYLNAGSMERYVISMPEYLTDHTSFNLYALAKATTFDELLNVLEPSEYYRIVGPFRPPDDGKTADITGCETALLGYSYQKSLEIVQKDYRGKTRRDLTELLHTRIDLHNLSVIVRLKHFFNADIPVIRERLIKVRGKIPPREYGALLQSGASASLERIRGMVRGEPPRFSEADKFNWVGVLSTTAKQGLTLRKFRSSQQAPVTLLSYISLLEIEAGNIVNIIEGTRYSVPAEEIRKLLVI